MVAVVVRDQDIVELLESGLVRGGDDAISVPPFVPGPAGVDQQRFSRWAHEERGLATLNVDEVNLE